MDKKRALMSSKAFPEIAGLASRFISFLRRHPLPGMLDLASPPDVDRLFVALEVEERARFDGGNDLPPSSEEVISGTQKEIIDYHRRLQAQARAKVKKLARRLLTEARRFDPSEVVDRLRDIPSKCENKAERALADFNSRLTLLHEQVEYEQQNLDGNDAQTQEDDSGRSATKAIFFVMMLAVTSLASLALGSDILWGGDASTVLNSDLAITIGVISVIVPFLIAVGVSKPISAKHNRERPAFRLAILLTILLLGLLAFWCAHLIMVSAGASVTGVADIFAAVNAMTTDPGAIRGDVYALRGFGIVMTMGCLGFALGNLSMNTKSKQDDARAAHFHARVHREKLAMQLREQINGIVDTAEKDMDRSATRLQKQFKKVSGLVEQARHMQAVYDDFLLGLEESCNLLLERYRQANAAVRSTDIPPSFSEQVCFRLEGADRKSFFEDGIELHREFRTPMNDFPETIAVLRRNLRSLNSNTIHSLGAVKADEETDEEADESYAYT